MAARTLDIPVFDADNHLYETRDSLTKFLPDRYKSAVDYVDVRGRTKIVVRGTISEYIPNPTFEVVARPGAQEDYFRKGNPEGKSRREIFGEPMRAIPAFREPAPRLELMDEQGIDRALCSRRSPASSRSGCATTPTCATPSSTRSTSGSTRRGRSTTRTASSPRR